MSISAIPSAAPTLASTDRPSANERAPVTSASVGSQLYKRVIPIVIEAGACAIGSYIFGVLNPVGAAVFGASSIVAMHSIHFLSEKFGITRPCAQGIMLAISIFAGIAIGAVVTTMVGFPMTVMVGVKLTLIAIAIRIIGKVCLNLVGGAALALADRRV